MGLNMTIVAVSGAAARTITEDLAADLEEAYEALSKLPSNRAVSVDFDTIEDADEFVKDAKAWATLHDLKFLRKGDVKELPSRVDFRIYKPRARVDDAESAAVA